jgi:hypothetical protein
LKQDATAEPALRLTGVRRRLRRLKMVEREGIETLDPGIMRTKVD